MRPSLSFYFFLNSDFHFRTFVDGRAAHPLQATELVLDDAAKAQAPVGATEAEVPEVVSGEDSIGAGRTGETSRRTRWTRSWTSTWQERKM